MKRTASLINNLLLKCFILFGIYSIFTPKFSSTHAVADVQTPPVLLVHLEYYSPNYNFEYINLKLIQQNNAHWTILDTLGNSVNVNDRREYLASYWWGRGYNLTIEQSGDFQVIPKYLTTDFHFILQLNASHLNIERIEKDSLLNATYLEILTLSHNQIIEVPANVFEYAPILRLIDLSYNDIEQIDKNAFVRTINGTDAKSVITEINLDNNKISFLNDSVFAIGSLEILSLRNNLFDSIDSQWFCNGNTQTFVMVGNLRLADNSKLMNFPRNEFRNVNVTNTNIELLPISPSAIAIYAENCKISGVSVFNPERDYRLETLCLSNNLLTSIATLEYLHNLEVLNVSHNLLAEIDGSIFSKFNSLRELDLSHNKLIEFDQRFLPHTAYLKYLNIGYNQLEHFLLKQKADHLETLQIDGNGLTSIDSNLIQFAPALKLISLNNNDFTCQYLTTSLLLLHYDGIRQIASNADELTKEQVSSGTWGHVKSIRCTNSLGNLDSATFGKAPSCKDALSTNLKNYVRNIFDNEMAQLQTNTLKILSDKFDDFEKRIMAKVNKN